MSTRDLRGQSDTDKLTTLDRERRAVTARMRGLPYEQVAELAGYADASGARRAVKRALDRNAEEISTDAGELRSVEVMRLDRAHTELSRIAFDSATGHTVRIKALEAMRKNIETRARLLGLFAPERVQVFTHDAIEGEIVRLSDELGIPVPPGVVRELPPGRDIDPA